ncbi:hypothetical protein EDC35_101618 [Thiobaca trueperi]|uniref:Uncharacterized protein n=2 Tax=Thiobaca trueperi TaxID=127458 RepID=A0A4R3N809_9GAMM|nr:hypothetical protein EDC35_101618 [Thiobaca trueperi]
MPSNSLSFNDAYKTWRNRARKYSRNSLIVTILNLLQRRHFDRFEALQRAPWISFLFLKWICQDPYFDRNIGRDVSDSEFNDLRNRLWNLTEGGHTHLSETRPGPLFLRQLINPQIPFQRRLTRGFVREAALLDQLQHDHPLIIMFRGLTGLSPAEFIDFSVAAHGAIANGNLDFSVKWFRPLARIHSGAKIQCFVNCIARTQPELIDFFRGLPESGRNRKVESEYYEFTPLRRYPFLLQGDVLKCWHPKVFERGIEGFVHSVLSEKGKPYIDRFSKIFERHIVDQAERIAPKFYDEAMLRGMLGEESKVPDGLLAWQGTNVFLESKAGLFDDSVLVAGHNRIFADKTSLIRKAIHQAWAVSVGISGNEHAPCEIRLAKNNYLLVITNKDINASRASMLAAMFELGRLEYPNDLAQTLLPLDHVYILFVDDYERLLAGLETGERSLPDILEDCVLRDSDPATSCYHFAMHLDHLKFGELRSCLVTNAFDQSLERLRVGLTGNT